MRLPPLLKDMRQYIIPFAAYVLTPLLLGFLLVSEKSSYVITMAITGGIMLFFWKSYSFDFKRIKWMGLAGGALLFWTWMLLEGRYPLLLESNSVDFSGTLMLILRFTGFVMITPLIEEAFTRGFLIRFIIRNDFEKVKPGTFTWMSFLITVLFFGFAHVEWLQGVVAALILNAIYYKTRSVEECIAAHVVANALLFSMTAIAF